MDRGHNKANHGDAYCIAASPPFRSRACWLALAGSAFVVFGGWVPSGLGRKRVAKSESFVVRQGRQNPWSDWQLNLVPVLV